MRDVDCKKQVLAAIVRWHLVGRKDRRRSKVKGYFVGGRGGAELIRSGCKCETSKESDVRRV